MKKSKLLVVLVLLFSLFLVPNAYAIDVEPSVGKIIGSYDYGDERIANADANIYLVGNVNASAGSYTYELLDEFSSAKVDFATLTNEQRKEYTNKLYSIISEKSIKPLVQVKTTQSGQFVFDNLKAGIYLIKVNDLVVDNGVYKSSPALIFFPDVTNDGSYVYDVSVNMKTEFIKSGDNNNNGDDNNNNNNIGDNNNGQNHGSNVNAPNTYDAIIMYVALFVVSFVLLAVLICYIYMFNKKKGKEKNEKDEQKK